MFKKINTLDLSHILGVTVIQKHEEFQSDLNETYKG